MYVENSYVKVYYSSVDGTNSYLPGANSFNSSTPLSANTWYHVVVTRDGNNNSMYINGALDATSTSTGNIATSSENSRIGSWNGNDFYWEGKIDKVGIWNTAISAQEVQNLNTNYSWDNGVTDGIAFVPTATTTYTVTATDANGCSATDAVDVTVNTLPAVDAGADQAVCDGGSVTLSASGAVTYAWDNNITDANAFTPTATATYTVNGTDANGCSNTDAVDVTVNALPAVNPGSNQAICGGDTITLYGDGSGGSNVNSNPSLSFNGSSDYITISDPNNSSVAPSSIVNSTNETSNWSVSLHIKRAAKNGNQTIIQSQDYNHRGWAIRMENNMFRVRIGNGSNWLDTENYGLNYTFSSGTSDTNWYHLVLVHTANNSLKLYVDGTLRITMDDQTTSNNYSTWIGQNGNIPINIGRHQVNWTDEYFQGSIDELSIWSYSLSQNEIQNLISCSPTGAENNLVGFWNLNSNSVTDISNNGNNGSVNGALSINNGPDMNCANNNITYSWDNNVSNGVAFSPTATATYTVTGTDANGCSNTGAVDVTVNALPTVNAGADQAVCDGGSVTLSASGAATYVWDNNITDATAFTPTATTTYTVTGTDANGCSNTDAVDVTVNALPTVDAGADQAVCDGGSVTLSASGAATYVWDNNITDATAFTPTATATYTVTGTDANGCSNTDAVDVTVNALPTVDAGADQAVCDGGSVTLSASGAATYAWDNNITDATAFTPTATATYTVTGTDANGCSNTDAVDVTVNALPTLDAGADQAVCDGESVTLSASGAVTYAWDNNITDATAFTPTATTTYTVTGTDANGCSNTDAVDVTVNTLPAVDAGADQAVCDGGSVTLSASGAVTYAWDNNITDAAAFTPTATTTYTVTGTDANGCSNTDAVDVVTVNSLYYNTLTIGACSGDSVFAGGSYQTASGVFVDSLQSINGCDSVVQTTLTIASQIVANIPLSVCFGDSALINGNYESVSGNFYDTTLSVAGCDSITITNFTVDALVTSNVSASICNGDSLFLGGAYQSAAGNYVDSLSTASGCDSLVTTTLTISSVITSNVSASICNGDSLFLGGAYQSAAGDYVDSLSTASGCDSLVTTTLTVNTASSSTDTQQAACDFTWIDGVTYTASNSTATFTTSNALGCDSVVALDLTINPIVATIAQNGNDIEASATNGAAPYSYDWSTGESAASITPAANGPYWVVVSDANACSSDTTSFDVTFVSGTGILSLDNLFNIYPNPTNDIINIDTKGNSQYLSANVYDIFGKLLINTSNNKIGLNKFEDGVYILEIKTPKNTYTTRIIKH